MVSRKRKIFEPIILCKDLNGFLEFVRKDRGVRGSETHLKFGVDGGGGSLKICLSIQSTNNDYVTDSKRRKYTDNIVSKQFRDSGVKKLFILALTEAIQENYENVLSLWSALDINKFIGTIAVELKRANILCGIMSHSCLFPCTWYFARKDMLHESAELRTVGNILINYNNWLMAGGDKNKAKYFMNCVGQPVLGNNDDKRIIDVVTPPALHLMLGAVNTIYSRMLAKFEDHTLIWTKKCNVSREVTRSGSGFNGNSCKTLLSKLDILRAICPIGCLLYVQALEDFRLVVKSYFGAVLDPNFTDFIEKFKQSFMVLESPLHRKFTQSFTT